MVSKYPVRMSFQITEEMQIALAALPELNIAATCRKALQSEIDLRRRWLGLPYNTPEKKQAYNKRYYELHQEDLIAKEMTRYYKSGRKRHMADAKDSASFLGVYVTERILGHIFNSTKRMPNGNPGYDFVCGKGFKIDAKSSCLRFYPNTRGSFWQFHTERNTTADYFFCLAFDNRESLEPVHIWLIPGNVINHLTTLSITNSSRGLAKWSIGSSRY